LTVVKGLLKTSLPIVRTYLLKEAFQKFWDCLFTGWAKRWLKQWFLWATQSRLNPLRDFAYLYAGMKKKLWLVDKVNDF